MPDQHKLTREEHKVAVVKFTQELTDHPAGQCWQRLRVKLILVERRVFGESGLRRRRHVRRRIGRPLRANARRHCLALLVRDPVRQRVSSEAAPYKLENKEAMPAVTVTKRPT